MKQLVAVRSIYSQILHEQRQNLRVLLKEKAGAEEGQDGFKTEELLQDLLTRRQMYLEEMMNETAEGKEAAAA